MSREYDADITAARLDAQRDFADYFGEQTSEDDERGDSDDDDQRT